MASARGIGEYPNIRSATPLDTGWYGTVVCSLMLSCILRIDNSCVLTIMISGILSSDSFSATALNALNTSTTSDLRRSALYIPS